MLWSRCPAFISVTLLGLLPIAASWSQPPAAREAARDAWMQRHRQPLRPTRGQPLSARNHIIVKLAAGSPPAAVGRSTAQAGYRLGPVRPGARWTTVAVPPGQNPRQVAARMRGLPGIEAAGLDPILYLHQTHLPTDDPWAQMPPYADEPCVAACLIDLFHPDCCLDLLFESLICQQWGLFYIDIETAWGMSHGHPGVVIAVIDSGVDLDHPDVHHISTGVDDPEVDKIWTNLGETVNGVDDDGNGYIDDIRGWDFCGTDVGDIFTEDATAANAGTPEQPGETGADSDDNNPDVFKGAGDWLWDDPIDPIYPIGFVGGDPSVGDLDDNDGNGYADIGVYHGSLVATIAAAVTNNVCPDIGYWFDGQGGFAGVGYNCTIMPLRMINAEGVGYGIDGYDAIMYAADNGADILNISWGAVNDPTHPDYDAAGNQMIHDAVQHAAAQGCVIVCSAGNFGGASQGGWTYTGGLDVPAAFPETISVGSIDDQGQLSDFSSWANSTEELDVVAPGEMISGAAVWSVADAAGYAFLGDAMVDPGAADWDSNQGTSFAAPIISGLAGLILARHPTYTPEQVRWVLRNGSTDLGPSGYDPEYGYGLAGGNLDAAPTGPPLAVWIDSLSARTDGAKRALTWSSDMGGLLAGFNVYEAPTAGGPYTKVDESFVSADPAAKSYRVLTAARGPWFRVEAVCPDGTRAGAQVLRVRTP